MTDLTHVTPAEEARHMDKYARQMEGAPSLAEVQKAVKDGAKPERVLAHLRRRARHDVIFAKHLAAYPRAEAVERFKAYWYGKGPDFDALEAKAQEVYGVPYVSLCCERKRAVFAAVVTARAERGAPR